MEPQAVDDVVGRLAFGAERDAGKVEVGGGDAGDGRSVHVVMILLRRVLPCRWQG